ncbi:hypothetical protein BC827DRAFT_890733 [Russula dissimulans]|nr:hypothetical protein BC827DRAFT_890733 [Russula dissimulans]
MLTDNMKSHVEGYSMHLVNGSQDAVLSPAFLAASATDHKRIEHNSKFLDALLTITKHYLDLVFLAIISSRFPDPRTSNVLEKSAGWAHVAVDQRRGKDCTAVGKVSKDCRLIDRQPHRVAVTSLESTVGSVWFCQISQVIVPCYFFFLKSFYCPLMAIPTLLCVAYLGPGLALIRSSEAR